MFGQRVEHRPQRGGERREVDARRGDRRGVDVDGSIEAESIVRLRVSASSVPIGTPSTVRPATDHVPEISGRPLEHWPVTRALQRADPDEVAALGGERLDRGVEVDRAEAGDGDGGDARGRGQAREAGQQRDPQLAEAGARR